MSNNADAAMLLSAMSDLIAFKQRHDALLTAPLIEALDSIVKDNQGIEPFEYLRDFVALCEKRTDVPSDLKKKLIEAKAAFEKIYLLHERDEVNEFSEIFDAYEFDTAQRCLGCMLVSARTMINEREIPDDAIAMFQAAADAARAAREALREPPKDDMEEVA